MLVVEVVVLEVQETLHLQEDQVLEVLVV